MPSNRFHSGTYSIYRYKVPYDGTYTVEVGVQTPEGNVTTDVWAGPNDFDPLNPHSR
ncbi:MAG: hypothetical protein INR66_21430 [Gordonia polyisoprenivorans]|nr:hypothetical protein [Gordonia polyisoprenivorans]